MTWLNSYTGIIFPLSLDVGVIFQFWIRFDFLDAQPHEQAMNVVHQNRIDAFPLILFAHRYQIQIEGVISFEGFE